MKVAIGMFYHEANSFNPRMVEKDDFIYAEGQEENCRQAEICFTYKNRRGNADNGRDKGRDFCCL